MNETDCKRTTSGRGDKASPKTTRRNGAHCGQKLKMTPTKHGYELNGRKGQFQSLLTETDTMNFRRMRVKTSPARVVMWRTTRGKRRRRFGETRKTTGGASSVAAAPATTAAAAAARGKTTSSTKITVCAYRG